MRKLCHVCAVLLLGFTCLAFAQQDSTQKDAPPQSGNESAPVFNADDGLIKLDVVVTDKSGSPVAGLATGDFSLLDNGQPQNVVSFRTRAQNASLSNPPVQIILVIDTVNQTPAQVEMVERGVHQFLQQNHGHLAEPVSIYRLSNAGLSSSAQPTVDGNELAHQVANRGEPHVVWQASAVESQTCLNNLYPACLNKLSLTALGSIVLEQRRKPGRKLLLWLGDGWPVEPGGEDSLESITEFSTRMREARIALYDVTVGPNPLNRPAYHESAQSSIPTSQMNGEQRARAISLPALAAQSGGGMIGPGDLATEIDHCVSEAGMYYTLTFDPPRTDQVDEYHQLKVALRNPSLTAHTRTGYYDEPVFYDQPSPAAEPVTVNQLQQVLEAARRDHDETLARRLLGMELTERMSNATVAAWKGRMPGPKSWAALTAAADASAFLRPPPSEIPSTLPPDLAEQKQMMARTVNYLAKTLPRLPDFFATRTTVRYEELPQKDNHSWKIASGDRILHPVSSATATVLYRNGDEVVDSEAASGKNLKQEESSLHTRGVFGPILFTVILDAAHSSLTWSRWEQSADGVRAVFSYAVPEPKAHYEVTYCCFTDMNGTRILHEPSAYHGEITIDPATGAILRLTLEADLAPRLPLKQAEILVIYGPVKIGGITYICLLRSVSISRGRTTQIIHEWGQTFTTFGPYTTMLNDVSFGDYHMFRSESHILTGDAPPPQKK